MGVIEQLRADIEANKQHLAELEAEVTARVDCLNEARAELAFAKEEGVKLARIEKILNGEKRARKTKAAAAAE